MSLLKTFYNRIEPTEKGTISTGPVTRGLSGSVDESIRQASRVDALDTPSETPFLSSRYTPRTFNVWAFSLLCGIAGTYSGVNVILAVGFGEAMLIQVLVAAAYIILVYSLAEIISTASFSGGTYGMTRVVFGFYPGFMVAAFEFLEFAMWSSLEVQFIVTTLIPMLGWDPSYQLWIAFLIYATCLPFLLERSYFWWGIITLLGVTEVTVLVIYMLGCIPNADFHDSASLQANPSNANAEANWFSGGMAEMLAVLPFTIWGCAGVESATFMTDLVGRPSKDIPRALVGGVWTLVIILFGTLFVAASVSPGLTGVLFDDYTNNIAAAYYYLVPGFMTMGMSQNAGIWLTMVAVYGCVISCLLPSTKLLQQMMGSRLLPSLPGYLDEHTNATAIIAVIFSFLLTVIALLHPQFNLTYLSIGFCTLSYMNDLCAFIRLRIDFGDMQREFMSPFGIMGAVYALGTFVLIFVGNFGYTNIPHLNAMFWGMIGILTLYYFGVARWFEKFSQHEEKHLLIFHIIKFNKHKRAQITRKFKRPGWSMALFQSLCSAPIQRALEMKLMQEKCLCPPNSTAITGGVSGAVSSSVPSVGVRFQSASVAPQSIAEPR